MTHNVDELVEAVDAQHTTTAEDTLENLGEKQACVSLTCFVGSGGPVQSPHLIVEKFEDARR